MGPMVFVLSSLAGPRCLHMGQAWRPPLSAVTTKRCHLHEWPGVIQGGYVDSCEWGRGQASDQEWPG